MTSIKSDVMTVNDSLTETISQNLVDASNDIMEAETHLNKACIEK